MKDTKRLIAGRLERVFAENGFAEPAVSELREGADVSLRTLYRHYPSRDAMVIGALEHRHGRYLAFVFDNLPDAPKDRLDVIFDRICEWMLNNAPQGCIFQNALAAHPHCKELGKLLLTHKKEVGQKLAEYLEVPKHEAALKQIHEGAIHSWVFQGREAIAIGRKLTKTLIRESPAARS